MEIRNFLGEKVVRTAPQMQKKRVTQNAWVQNSGSSHQLTGWGAHVAWRSGGKERIHQGEWWKSNGNILRPNGQKWLSHGVGFKHCSFFTPAWQDDPIWRIFFQMGWNHQYVFHNKLRNTFGDVILVVKHPRLESWYLNCSKSFLGRSLIG